MRKLERVKDFALQGDGNVMLPKRATKHSAGYDFYSPIDAIIPPFGFFRVPTDIKVKMEDDEAFILCNRSSFGPKGVVLANAIGLIDSDYYENTTNDGNISFTLHNLNETPFIIKKGDRIGQGFFIKYLKTDDDNAEGERIGGYGSTGK